MGKNFILLLTLISFNNLLNAQDLYDEYKVNYDRLRKEEKHDSALVFAKQMNFWALQNETDTSLRYAVSLMYVGNCFTTPPSPLKKMTLLFIIISYQLKY